MPQFDASEKILIEILEKEGWKIFANPFVIPFGRRTLQIDLGIEKLIGIEKDQKRLLVEVKSFSSGSLINDLQKALGQYSMYKLALELRDITYSLYLAVPDKIIRHIESDPDIFLIFSKYNINFMSYDESRMVIIKWEPKIL